MKDATIKDIAAEAQVSISTVSRVVNGNYPVSKAAKTRVLTAMQKLDYHPNAVARSLRNNRTNLVALIIADLSNQFFMEIAKGLEAEVNTIGDNLMIAASGNDPARENQIIDTLIARKVDGLVIATAGDESRDAIRKVQSCGIPLVLVDRSLTKVNANQILWDDFQVSYALTQLLIAQGHTKIGIVNVTLRTTTGKRRLDGFLKALNDYQLSVDASFVSDSNFDADEAYQFVRQLFSKQCRPTALVCENNIMALGTLRALRDLRLEVGKDVSLVVFGNIITDLYLPFSITHACQDSVLMGRKAGQRLIANIQNPEMDPAQEVISCPIVHGDSVRKL